MNAEIQHIAPKAAFIRIYEDGLTWPDPYVYFLGVTAAQFGGVEIHGLTAPISREAWAAVKAELAKLGIGHVRITRFKNGVELRKFHKV